MIFIALYLIVYVIVMYFIGLNGRLFTIKHIIYIQ